MRLVFFICIAATAAFGQATRTWVSGVGDDANPCSRTAPCKTFAGAISKTAASGEIDVLDPGGFGAVTITKSITIDGTPFLAGVLVSGTAGIIINAGANDAVVLRGLDINGLGTGTKGVQILQAGKVVIQDCQIYGFTPRGVSVEPSANPVQVYIENTHVKNNASNGIVVAPASPAIKAAVTLNNVDVHQNTNFGVSMVAGSAVVIRNSSITDNGGGAGLANVRLDGTGGAATVDLDNVTIAGGNTGLLSLGGGLIRVNNSTIVNNGTGLSLSGGNIFTFGNNRVTGNTVNGFFNGTIALQ